MNYTITYWDTQGQVGPFDCEEYCGTPPHTCDSVWRVADWIGRQLTRMDITWHKIAVEDSEGNSHWQSAPGEPLIDPKTLN